MINIVVNTDPKYTVNKLAIQGAVLEILQQNSVSGDIELGVSIIGDSRMHEFNKKYRGIDSTTNILSFALEDPISVAQLQHVPKVGFVKSPNNVIYLGDIMLSYPMVVKDASLGGVTVEQEMLFLVQHGTRHLLGIHHD
jgi:probable rRNA maturation factor